MKKQTANIQIVDTGFDGNLADQNVTTLEDLAQAVDNLPFVNQSVLDDSKDPTGWLDSTAIAISYNKTNRTITLTGTLVYYWRGVKTTLTSPWTSPAHSSADGDYFLYSSDGINFTWSTTVWTFDLVMVAKASLSTTPAYQFAISELHGLMPWQAHKEFHEAISSYRESGGALTGGTYAENTATDAATTPAFDAAVMWDEDNKTDIAAWTQGTYTTLRIGTSSKATFDTAASFPFRSSGSYILVNTPSTGGEAAGTNNQYVNVYQVMIPCATDTDSQLYRMVMLQPQAAYSSLAAAQAEDPRGLSLGDLVRTSPEFVFYARITYALAAGDTNTGKCRIATGGVTYLQGSRMAQVSGGGVPNAENIPFAATGTIAATNVQAAIAEVAAAQAFTLIADSGILGASAATIDFQNIPATYSHLRLVCSLRSDRAAVNDNVAIRFNNDSGANYDYGINAHNNAARVFTEGLAQTSTRGVTATAGTAVASDFARQIIDIPDYANANSNKDVISVGGYRNAATTNNILAVNAYGHWRSTAAIDRITLLPVVGTNWVQYSRVTLYGY